jgi:hypothetical protein
MDALHMTSDRQIEEASRRLDPKTLMSEAELLTGLRDYGDNFLYQPFVRFMQRAALEVSYVPGGLEGFRGDILRHLTNRLRTQEDIRQHPEILEEEVSDPIVITGLPRTGTTKLHRMLASADTVQKLPLWRMLNPARIPDEAKQGIDARLQAGRLVHGGGGESADQRRALQAAHEMILGEVEEEVVLFEFVLDPSTPGFNALVPLFFHEDWASGSPERLIDWEAYKYLRLQIQYLQWQDGGRRGRPWILKTISHAAHMDCLLAMFPKATLVHCHRNPLACVPSAAKLMRELWNLKAQVDVIDVGRQMMGWTASLMERNLEARERLGLDNRIIEVRYEDVRSNVMPVIKKIYARAGWQLTPAIEQTMREWENKNEQGKHGQHRYSLEESGLNVEMIESAFAGYNKRFAQLF